MSELVAKKKVVVIGGGTGTHTVLRGLRRYTDSISLTAVVSMADSGGSTGRLRDEFGQLPVGDVRNALTALADVGDSHGELLRELFLYRFRKGVGLRGHNFGNLLLTALTDILGSEVEAIRAASLLLRISGVVVPVTTGDAHLCATYDDGVVLHEESLIDDPAPDRYARRITQLALIPEVVINPEAAAAIRVADLVVIGPGDLYTSLLPNALVQGMQEAMRSCTGTIVYVGNLMSRRGQTQGMKAEDCLAEIAAYFGRAPHHMLVNSAPIPPELILAYRAEGEESVVYTTSTTTRTRVVALPLLAGVSEAQSTSDAVRRSLIRHDHERLAAALMRYL